MKVKNNFSEFIATFLEMAVYELTRCIQFYYYSIYNSFRRISYVFKRLGSNKTFIKNFSINLDLLTKMYDLNLST